MQPSTDTSTDHQTTPLAPASQPTGYHVSHGSGASAQPVSARLVPDGPTRPRRAAARGGKVTADASGPRKRLATALSPDPKVSADSDAAKLQELVLASIPIGFPTDELLSETQPGAVPCLLLPACSGAAAGGRLAGRAVGDSSQHCSDGEARGDSSAS